MTIINNQKEIKDLKTCVGCLFLTVLFLIAALSLAIVICIFKEVL